MYKFSIFSAELSNAWIWKLQKKEGPRIGTTLVAPSPKHGGPHAVNSKTHV